MRGKASSVGYTAIRAKLERLANAGNNSVHSVDVGIIKSATYPPRRKTEDPPSVQQVALWNEFGTRGGYAGGGWGGPTPPRPFMNNSFKMSQNDPNIKNEIKAAFAGDNPSFDEKTAARIGAMMQANMIEAMQDSGLAPNAPLTIRLKKSSKPLHDTGLLRRSIEFRVNKSAPDESDGGVLV